MKEIDTLDRILSKSHPLKKDDELDLCKEYQRTKNKKLLSKIIESNLRFVAIHAHIWNKKTKLSLLDLFQEGSLGLVESLDTFNTEKNTRLIGHAKFFIRKRMLYYVLMFSKAMRLPLVNNNRKKSITRSIVYLIDRYKNGDEESLRNYAKESKCTLGYLKSIIFYFISSEMSNLVDENGNSVDVYDNMSHETGKKIDIINLDDLLYDQFVYNKMTSTCTPREMSIIIMRFWFEYSMEQIGKELGISKAYVDSVLKGVLKKMKKRLNGSE